MTLARDKDFELFDGLLSQRPKTQGMCLGCVKNDVKATLTGRIDGTDDPGLKRDAAGKITGLDGFGNLNEYAVQMVLTKVSDATAQEIDFSKAPAIKDDKVGSGEKDFAGSARKSTAAFAKGTPAVDQVNAAIDALGAPGVDNGVSIGWRSG